LNKSTVSCFHGAFNIPLSAILCVEAVFSEWTHIWIGLIITLAVDTLEHVRTRLFLLGFQSRWVDLAVHLATPSKLPMVFQHVRSIAFDTFGALDPAESHCMTPIPAVFSLRNT